MVYLSIQFCVQLPNKELARIVPIAKYFLIKQAKNAAKAAEQAAKQAKATTMQAAAKTTASVVQAAGKAGVAAVSLSTTDSQPVGAEAQAAQQQEAGPGEAPKIPPEQFAFAVNWAKVMLATTLGMCYAMIQPFAILFGLGYLIMAYLFARGLLYTYTHASESRGSFWPVVSARFLVILMFAQLILTAIHAIRKGVVTASFVALTMPVTWAAHRSFVARFEKQFGVLPLISSAGVDNSDEQKEFQSAARPSLG